MYTQEEYWYGWLLYLAGVVILMGCGWILTARIGWKPLRQLLRLLAAVALLVPWYANPDMTYLAPAWLIAGFEGVFEKNFWRAGGPLLSALGVALVLGVAAQLFLRARANRRAS
jgi:hypothetical protein